MLADSGSSSRRPSIPECHAMFQATCRAWRVEAEVSRSEEGARMQQYGLTAWWLAARNGMLYLGEQLRWTTNVTMLQSKRLVMRGKSRPSTGPFTCEWLTLVGRMSWVSHQCWVCLTWYEKKTNEITRCTYWYEILVTQIKEFKKKKPHHISMLAISSKSSKLMRTAKSLPLLLFSFSINDTIKQKEHNTYSGET